MFLSEFSKFLPFHHLKLNEKTRIFRSRNKEELRRCKDAYREKADRANELHQFFRFSTGPPVASPHTTAILTQPSNNPPLHLLASHLISGDFNHVLLKEMKKASF